MPTEIHFLMTKAGKTVVIHDKIIVNVSDIYFGKYIV